MFTESIESKLGKGAETFGTLFGLSVHQAISNVPTRLSPSIHFTNHKPWCTSFCVFVEDMSNKCFVNNLQLIRLSVRMAITKCH